MGRQILNGIESQGKHELRELTNKRKKNWQVALSNISIVTKSGKKRTSVQSSFRDLEAFETKINSQ